jgi:hypothetical protein
METYTVLIDETITYEVKVCAASEDAACEAALIGYVARGEYENMWVHSRDVSVVDTP